MKSRLEQLYEFLEESPEDLSRVVEYETPAPRGTVTLVDGANVEELVSLLHNKARVI